MGTFGRCSTWQLGVLCGALWKTSGALAAEATAPEPITPRSQTDTVRVVTLQRTSVFATSRAVSALDTDELRELLPRSVGESLRSEEAVTVLQPSTAYAGLTLRGLGEGRVQLYMDGVRLSNTLTSTLPGGMSALNLVDPFILTGIDVVRGPGLGPVADGGLGGVVSLRTMQPTAIAGHDIRLSGRARAMYSSADQSFQGSLYGGGRWNRFALDTAFSARRMGDLLGGQQTGTQPLTGYSEGNLYLGLGVDTGHGTLSAVFQGARQYSATRSERNQAGDVYELPEVARNLAYLRYQTEIDRGGRIVEISAMASYQRLAETASRQLQVLDRVIRHSNLVDVFGLNAWARSDLGRAGQLAMGVEGAFEWVSSDAEQRSLSQGMSAVETHVAGELRYPDGSRAQTITAFVQDDIDLERLVRGGESDRPGRLKLLVAARGGVSVLYTPQDRRLERLGLTGPDVVLPERQLVRPLYGGSLHLRYEPVAGLAVFGGGMLGRRAATLDDQARLDLGRPVHVLPTSAELPTETALSAEIGLRAAYRRFEGQLAYAYTYLLDPLLVVPFGDAATAQPCAALPGQPRCAALLTRAPGEAVPLHTIEASARLYLMWGFSLLGTAHYTHVPSTSTGATALPRVPPLQGSAALEFRRPRTTFSLIQAYLRWSAPQNRFATEDLLDATLCPTLQECLGAAGFVVVGLRSAFELAPRQVYLTATVENLSNAAYRVVGSGILGPGLSGQVGLEGTY